VKLEAGQLLLKVVVQPFLFPNEAFSAQKNALFGRKRWKMGENHAIMTSQLRISPKSTTYLGENRSAWEIEAI